MFKLIKAFFFPNVNKEFIQDYLWALAALQYYSFTELDESYTNVKGSIIFWFNTPDGSTHITTFKTLKWYKFIFICHFKKFWCILFK